MQGKALGVTIMGRVNKAHRAWQLSDIDFQNMSRGLAISPDPKVRQGLVESVAKNRIWTHIHTTL